jgi:tRNA pseudouridine38-40 synthase
VGKDLSRRKAVLVRFGYDGARFFGLQPQPGLPTAGGALLDRLTKAVGARPSGLAFAARTDRGVHAERNLATCYWRKDVVGDVDVDRLAAAVHADTGDGLRDVELVGVPPTVHARGISRGKHYRYRIKDGADPDELDDTAAWRIVPAVDVAAMGAAALHLRGRHDFSSLRGGGCSASSAEKTLFSLTIARADDGAVTVDVVGDAFVRHMVRNLVGLLVEVGTGLRSPADVDGILAARHRQAAGLMAPGAGLTLVAVGSSWPADGSGRLPGALDEAGANDDSADDDSADEDSADDG